MRAVPVNTLNSQRAAMIVADFVKVSFLSPALFVHWCLNFSSFWRLDWNLTQTGRISSPADLRYREDLLFPGRIIEDAGSVQVGRALHKVVKPSKMKELKELFAEEKFILSRGNKWTDMVLEQNASGEDALRGWLVAAYAASMEKSSHDPSLSVLQDAYEKMNSVFTPFLSGLRAKGWYTDRFLDGIGSRFEW